MNKRRRLTPLEHSEASGEPRIQNPRKQVFAKNGLTLTAGRLLWPTNTRAKSRKLGGHATRRVGRRS
jgi:hypothetical protein